ncbi:phosphotransferase family protein, partial [Streptomyces clavuligerus]
PERERGPWPGPGQEAGPEADDGPGAAPYGAGRRTAALPTTEVGGAAFARLLDGLARQAPDLFAEVRDRLTGPKATALVRAAEKAGDGPPPVLLHGDFSLRNTARDRTGRPVVFDFERAEHGPPEYDLQRIWGGDLAAIPGGQVLFTAAYRAARAEDPGPLDRSLLDYARLACAITTLTAARRTQDTQFESEGRKILEGLT